MPTNQLAPPDMPWLTGGPPLRPNGLGPPMLNYAAPPSDTTQGAGVAAAGQQAWQWLQDQRAESTRQGLLDPDTGLPTQAGLVDAARQTAEGVMMGTTAPGDVPPPGIVAYHGSPADFNRFDDRFIGTGEGAQAYGRGHYFGGAEETGRNYRDALTPETIPNPEFNAAQQEYNAKYGAVGNAAGATDAEFNAAIAARDAAHEKMKSLPPTIPNPAFPGHMYQVNIGAEPEHFLDWDKPLSEQHPVVQEALAKAGAPSVGFWKSGAPGEFGYHSAQGQQGNVRPIDRGMGDGPEWLASYDTLDGRGSQRFKTQQEAQDWIEKSAPIEAGRGADVYQTMRKNNPNDAAISQALQQAGVPGIRYLDQGSRGAGQGTHNYVVFDPATIEILRKYGIAGLGIGLGGAAAAGTQQQQPSQ